MKIGILTFQSSHNCGSMLQAYALREVLARKYGADAEIIDYNNFVSRSLYGYLDFRPKKSAVRKNINTLLHFRAVRESRKWYCDFSGKHLHKSAEICRNRQDLIRAAQKYDLLIAGGDQIWNVRCQDAGREFFLDFIHGKRKAAYSPSLGGTNILKYADDLQAYRAMLADFQYLSVREPNGKKWLEQLTGREVPIVCDPAMLLTVDEWTQWLPVPEIEGPYIFNYAFYHNNPQTNEVLQAVSAKLRMPVIVMDYKSYDFYRLSQYGIRKCVCSGPLAFLGLMKNADLVLTQSFHGTLFSALFHRNFWSYDCKTSENADDDRAIAILNQLGLADRYVSVSDLLTVNLMQQIRYDPVSSRIDAFRKESYRYIDQFMGKEA